MTSILHILPDYCSSISRAAEQVLKKLAGMELLLSQPNFIFSIYLEGPQDPGEQVLLGGCGIIVLYCILI